jgi:uncharacterized membrane protein YhiD involved in acid resistance
MQDFFNLVGQQVNMKTELIVVSLLFSFAAGLIISVIYKKTNKGFSYESGFAFSIVIVTVVVTSIMITISSNLTLSLGLIGALSIIRFRTAVKSTMDMAFLFWSISVGLAIGAKNYPVSIITLIIVGVIILIVDKIKMFSKSNTDYVLVIQHSQNLQEDSLKIAEIFSGNGLKWKLKSSFIDDGHNETTYSIYSSRNIKMEELLLKIRSIGSVKRVSLLAPDTNLYI